MTIDDPKLRIDAIETHWTLLQRAHSGDEKDAAFARAKLIEEYGNAVRRYLLGSLRDQDDADELFQEFAYRLLHGDFKNATPVRGRFRDFLKGALSHLTTDFFKRKKKNFPNLAPGFQEPQCEPDDLDLKFRDCFRDELLARTWTRLKELETQTGQLFHTVLKLRANHPELRSNELAIKLGESLHQSITAAGFRQLLHRSRGRFGEFLILEVRNTLSDNSPELLQEELSDLGLLTYLSL